MSDCPVLQNTGCGSIGIMPQKGHECDQSPGTRVTFRSRPYPYCRQEPAVVTGVLQEAGNLFMPVIHLLQNYSELYQSISFECLSVC